LRAVTQPPKIGRFLIEETLGYGASGAVYKAFDPVLNRPVAIKTLRFESAGSDESRFQGFIQRFLNEAQVVGTLSHPNIVTLFDAGETDEQTPFLAMEFADGETFAARLESGGAFPASEALHYLIQIASALDYAHEKGVLHRDVKPSNLICHEGSSVKITDFGIARLMSLEGEGGTLPPGQIPSRLTSPGGLLGSPSYMSPEQAQGEPVDARSDVFSLGVVAYEMLTSRLPFEGSTITATLYKLLYRDPEKPQLLDEIGLDGELWGEVFSRALAKNPRERYQTAGDLLEGLRALLEPGVSSTARLLRSLSHGPADEPELGTIPFERKTPAEPARPVPSTPPSTPSRLVQRLRPWGLAVALAALVVLLAVSVTALRLRSVPSPPPVPTTPAAVTEEAPEVAVAPVVVIPPDSTVEKVDYKPPRRTHWETVRYPYSALARRIEGRVGVRFRVTPQGRVEDIVLDRSTGSELDQAVVDAVRSWKYRPAYRNRTAVSAQERFEYDFKLPK